MKNIKAIIFDMNGVIVDDEPIHELAFKSVLKNYGIKLTSNDYSDLCMGRTDKGGFEAIMEKFSLNNIDINDLIAQKSKKYPRLITGNVKSIRGVIELIKKLAKKYPLALTSSSTRGEVETILKIFEIKKYFKVIVSAEDITHGKPNPEPYLLTAKKLRINPANCLVIEDSKNGVISAKCAGMKCLAIAPGYKGAGLKLADRIINNFSELGNIFK